MSIEAIAVTAVSVTGVLGFLGVVLKRAYHLAKLIEGRSKQLEHNGGSSMRDDMTHVRKSIDTVGDQVRTVSVDVLGVHGRLDAMEQWQRDHDAAHRETSVNA